MPRRKKSSEITIAFHNFVHAWESLKDAEEDYNRYAISREELFDHRMYEHDMEFEFIDISKKYGDSCEKNK